MTALPTVDDAVQQRFAGPRYAGAAVAIVLTVIALQHGLDLLEPIPGNIRRILVAQAYLPLFHRQAFLQLFAILPVGLSTAPDIGSGISRIVQDGRDGCGRRPAPDDLSPAILARDPEVLLTEITVDLCLRSLFLKGVVHHGDTPMEFLMRVFPPDTGL